MTRLLVLLWLLALLLCGAQLRTPRIERGIARPQGGTPRVWRAGMAGRRWVVGVYVVRLV